MIINDHIYTSQLMPGWRVIIMTGIWIWVKGTFFQSKKVKCYVEGLSLVILVLGCELVDRLFVLHIENFHSNVDTFPNYPHIDPQQTLIKGLSKLLVLIHTPISQCCWNVVGYVIFILKHDK